MESLKDSKIVKFPFILSLSFIFFSLCSFIDDEEKIDYPLEIVCVKNTDLLIILDSIIDYEKQCDYYSSDLLFSISVLPPDNYIRIGSRGERSVNKEFYVGCIEFNGHLILVDHFDNRLFKKTGKKKNYIFSKSLTKFDENGNLLVIDSDEWMQNDSYSHWCYIYTNKRIIFDSKSTYCDEKEIE